MGAICGSCRRCGYEESGISLPQEVWRKVAGYMSLRDWALAAGTCRMLWNLDLDVVNVDNRPMPPERGVSVSTAGSVLQCRVDLVSLCSRFAEGDSYWLQGSK